MGTNTALLEKTLDPAAKAVDPAVPTAQPKTYYFTCYGSANPRKLAALAAAKVLLEGAIAAEREAEGEAARAAVNAGLVRRHYIVGLIASGEIGTSTADTELETMPPLFGSMSIRQLQRDERADFGAQTSLVSKVRLARKRNTNAPVPASLGGSRTRDTVDFTVIDGRVSHCVWASSRNSASESH
jgi:hypothetical protein